MAISRRNFIVAASAAGGGAALSPFDSSQAQAQGQASVSKVENPGFHRFQFGDFEITTLSDGRRAGEAPEKPMQSIKTRRTWRHFWRKISCRLIAL
ncbi:beta-lactamase domain-containing protein [Ochrobactrum sp. CDB2]|nr:beta-lactamase domain-containing protein [Ochrobactrum sp. CDB2]